MLMSKHIHNLILRAEWFDVLVAVVKYRLPRFEESFVDKFSVLKMVMV
jgi:hypothetical protein